MSAKFTLNNALHLEMSYVEHWSIFGNSLLAFPESIDSVTLSINQRQYNINYMYITKSPGLVRQIVVQTFSQDGLCLCLMSIRLRRRPDILPICLSSRSVVSLQSSPLTVKFSTMFGIHKFAFRQAGDLP